MKHDPEDQDVLNFVMTCPATSWSTIAKLCEVEFGRDRAWPVSLIKTVRGRIQAMERKESPYRRDRAVMALINDRMDLIPLDALLREGKATFPGRFPSRSALHRLITDLRCEALVEAQCLTGRANP